MTLSALLAAYLVAQVDPLGDGWASIVEVYGPFAPFAGLLLWLFHLLWKDNKAKEAEIKELQGTAMERVLPLVLDATRVLGDAVKAVHSLQGFNQDIVRVSVNIQDLQDAIEDLRKIIIARSVSASSEEP